MIFVFIPRSYLRLGGLGLIILLIVGILNQALGLDLRLRFARKHEVSLVAVGDIMVGRRVAETMRLNGPRYPFARTAGILQDADITFANLESPLGLPNSKFRRYGLFAPNPEAVQGLKYAGIDIVSLANNHACDCDKPVLVDTMTNLKENQILYSGAGANLEKARRPTIIVKNGLRIAFLSYCEFSFIWSKLHPMFRATETAPGIIPLEKKYLVEDVRRARKIADVVVVSLHFGREYVDYPTKFQMETAHLAVDNGAHLVLGHHPHCLQGIERYKSGVICYSLGNFVFDLKREKTKTGMIFQCTLTPKGVKDIEILPVYITNSQPQPLEGTWKQSVLKKIDFISRRISAPDSSFSILN